VVFLGEAAVRAEAQTQAEAVAQRVAADVHAKRAVHKGMALLAEMEAGRL